MADLKRHCGACSLCCKVMGVPEVKKDFEWCPHARPKNQYGACSIYETRPGRCADFHCQWLLDKRFPDYWFPKLSKIVVDTKIDDAGTWVYFVVDPVVPDRWRQEPWFSDIKQIASAGLDGKLGKKWSTLVLIRDQRILIGQ